MMDKKGTPPNKFDTMVDNMVHPKRNGAGGATYTTTTAAAAAPPAAPPPTPPAKKAPAKPATKPEPKKSTSDNEAPVALETIEKEKDARGSVMAPPKPPPPEKADGAEEELPEGWTAMPDEETGRKYYYNTKTGDTQWKKPNAPAEGQEGQV